jgi:hypothetical protein
VTRQALVLVRSCSLVSASAVLAGSRGRVCGARGNGPDEIVDSSAIPVSDFIG